MRVDVNRSGSWWVAQRSRPRGHAGRRRARPRWLPGRLAARWPRIMRRREERAIDGRGPTAASDPLLEPHPGLGGKVTRSDRVWVAVITCMRLYVNFVELAILLKVFIRGYGGWDLGPATSRGSPWQTASSSIQHAMLSGACATRKSPIGMHAIRTNSFLRLILN